MLFPIILTSLPLNVCVQVAGVGNISKNVSGETSNIQNCDENYNFSNKQKIPSTYADKVRENV